MFNSLWFRFGGYPLNYVAPAYNILNHPLLSPAARRLSNTVLVAQGNLAQDLLGLTGTAFTGTIAARLTDYIVLQVNFQVEAETSGYVYQSKGRGARSVTYAGHHVHPVAAAGVRAVLRAAGVGGYPVLLSKRPIAAGP